MAVTRALDDIMMDFQGKWFVYDESTNKLEFQAVTVTSLEKAVSGFASLEAILVLTAIIGISMRPRLREAIHLWACHRSRGQVSHSILCRVPPTAAFPMTNR